MIFLISIVFYFHNLGNLFPIKYVYIVDASIYYTPFIKNYQRLSDVSYYLHFI